MELRKIAIANNKTQKRYTIESSAETLGELKAQLRTQGIDYSGMTFTEGITKTQLISDDSLLPTNVTFRGQVTNDLVMLLTNPTKQIASGGYPTNRKEFGEYIKKNSLGDKIKKQFGDNWTRVSTDSLLKFFAAQDKSIKNTAAKTEKSKQELEKVREELTSGNTSKPVVEESPKAIVLPEVKNPPHPSTVEWFYGGIKGMVKDSLLHTDDVVALAGLVTELVLRLREEKSEISDSDITDMMNSIR